MQQHSRQILHKQEAVRVGNLVVLAQRDQKGFQQQKQVFATRGYRLSETSHFLLCRKPSSTPIVLMHRFGPAEIDADIICFIEDELGATGIIPSAKDFGVTLFAILASAFPSHRDQSAIWRRFCLNTLTKLRDHLTHPLVPPPTVSYVAPFATIYRRVLELFTGQSFLDVGCSFGFLPVLMAEYVPDACVMGCDNNPDAIGFSTDLAAAIGVPRATFSLQDVRDVSIRCLGTFDTVTALHVLEHLPEQDLPLALGHLLQLSAHRLIIAVPYESQAIVVYGHAQVFTRAKLEQWGAWCIEALEGAGRYWCEDVAGGLLIIEHPPRQK